MNKAFWDGFGKEANAVTTGVTKAFKGLAKPTAAPKSLDGVLDYAKMNAPKPRLQGKTLDYGAMNNAAKAEKGIAEAGSGTIDYSSGSPKQTQAPMPIARGTAPRPQLSQTAMARVQHATRGKAATTDWSDALRNR